MAVEVELRGIDKLSSVLAAIRGQMQQTAAEAQSSAGAMTSAFGGVGAVLGGAATAGIAVFGAALAATTAVVGGALASWKQLDDAADTLTLKTGATGGALDGLTQSTMALYNSSTGLSSSTGQIASAMGTLEQITGAAGSALQNATGNFLYLQQAEGQAAGSAESFGRAMQSWNVPAAQMSSELDKQYAAFQRFGVGTGEINQALVQFGGQLRQMNLSLDQAEGLFSSAYAAGINVDKMLTALSTAAGKFAKDGIDAGVGLRKAFDEIKNVENPVKAAQIAVETFGQKAGPALADAIRQGKVSLEGLQAQLGDTTGSLKKAVEATMDFPEKLTLMGREIMTALQPAGKAIADSLGKALDEAKPAIDSLAASIGQMAMKVAPLIEGAFAGAKQFLSPLIGAAETLRPSIEQLGAAFGRLGDAIGGAFGMDPGKALSGWNDAVIVAAAWTQVLTDKFTAFVDQIAGEVQPAILVTGAVLSKIGDVLTNNVLPPLGTLLGPLKQLNDALFQLSPIGMAVSSVFGGLGDSMGSIDWTRAGKALQATYDTIVLVLGDIIQATANAMQGINITLQQGPAAGLAYFQNSMENLRADHQAKWTAIEAHLQMSMVSTQSSIATGMVGWQSVFGAGLNGMVQEAATAAAQIREQMRLIQLGTQLGNASRGQLDVAMHPELASSLPEAPKVPAIAASVANIGANVGKELKGTQKTAEELAKEAADTLKSIMDSVEKMKEFLDEGYRALVGDGELAGQITDLSQALFDTGRIFAEQLAASVAGFKTNLAVFNKKTVDLTDEGARAMQDAANTLKALVELIPKMFDFMQSDAWAAVQATPEQFTAMSQFLIDMGKQFYEQMAAASVGVSTLATASAKKLGEGIGTAASALSAMVGLLPKLYEWWESGGYEDAQAARGALLNAAQWLIDFGKDTFVYLAAAGAGLKQKTVEAAKLLGEGIQASASAVQASLSMVVALFKFVDEGTFEEVQAVRGQLIQAAQWLTDFGKDVFTYFAAAGADVKARSVEAAKRLSEGIQASASAIGATLKLVQDLLAASFDPSFMDALAGETRNRIMAVAEALTQMGRQMFEQFAAAGADVKQRTVVAAQRLSEGVKAASDGLKAAADSVKLLLDVGSQPQLVEALSSGTKLHEWVLGIAMLMSRFARDITEEWGAAGLTLGSRAVAAAKRLGEGVKAAGDGIKATGDALGLLLLAGSTLETIVALDNSTKLNAWALGIGALLADFALALTNEWGRVGALLGSVTVDAVKRLGEGAKATSDGIASTTTALRTLLDSTRLLTEVGATFTVGDLMALTSFLANIALLMASEWGRVGAWFSDAANVGVKRLAEGMDATAKGVQAVATTIRAFVDSQRLLMDAQGILSPNMLLALTSWFANVALVMAGEWGRVGAWLSSGAQAGGKALGDGMAAVASGVGAVVTTIQAFVDSTRLVMTAQALLDPATLTGITGFFANIALIMAAEWGRVGSALSSAAATGGKALSDGMASVSSGVGAVVTTVQAFVDSAALLLKAQAFLTPTMLTNITSFFANVALIMASEWGRVGGALSGPAQSGAKALADGAASIAGGVKSVADTLALLTGKDLAKAIAALPTADFVGWLTGITSFLANVALIMVNEWGRIGAALAQGAVQGAAQLSSGIGSVSSALSSTIDTLKALADWLKKPVEYTSQIEQAAVTLAQDAAALWVAIANALAKLSPPTEAQTEAVKTWTSLSDFTSQAMSMLDVLPKLRDWTKAPVELSDAMLSETDTLARAWVTIWRKIAVALIAIGSPDEAQAAAVKAWSDVGDFLSNVASLFDLLPKLAAWTKTPTELSSDMLTSVDTLARNWVAIWRKIADALIAVGSPTDAQTAAVKAWSEVSDFLGNVASLFDLLPKLAAWVKAPTELSNDMLNATDTLARAWVTIWRKIADALIAVGSPSDAQTAATKAWTEVSDFLGNVSSLFDLLPKLRDWTKAPVELSDAMLSETDTLARAWVTIWRKIADALVAVGSPSDAQTAAVKAWSEVSDFMGSVASLFDFLPKLRDWVKSPTELNADMLNATDTLARDWVSLWQKIADALIAVGSPSDAQKAAVKAWAEVSDFLGNVANLFDLLPKLRDWVKSPVELSTDMTNAAGTLATQWTVLWAKIADALLAVAVPSDAQKAAVKAWSEAGDFMSQTTGMMDTLTKLHDWLKESHQLTQPMQDEAANLATEFTVLWKKIADTLKDITPPTDVQKAAVEAWTKVADAFGIIDKTLSTIKSLMEFSFTTKVGDTSVTQTSIPAVATIQQRVKDALAVGVMMLQAIVTAAQDPTLANDLTTAAQEASAALTKVAGDAFTVIGGVLSTVKSLFEFGVNNPAGWVQQQGGNNIWSTGSFTAGIPDSAAVTAKVTALMAALKAIVDEVKNGVANIALGEDPAALQAKLAQVLAIVSTAAALVKAAQDMAAGGTGKFALSISIAVAFAIPDLAAEIAKINVPVIHIPVVWDVPPLPTGNSGSGYVSGAPGNSGSASLSSAPGNSGSGSVTSITVNQYVSPQIAADPAGTIIQLKGLYA